MNPVRKGSVRKQNQGSANKHDMGKMTVGWGANSICYICSQCFMPSLKIKTIPD